MSARAETVSEFLPRPAVALEVRQLSPQEKLFRVRPEDGVPLNHLPGQFVEVSLFGIGEAPISICSAPTGGPEFELCVRTVANLTQGLHSLLPGDRIGLRGPYGTHYPVEEAKGRDLLCVAGGLGLAPLRSFIQYVLLHRADYGRLIILYGSRTPEERIFTEDLERWAEGSEVDFLETVDRCPEGACWRGHIGLITTLFPQVSVEPANTCLVAVGPPVMYRFVVAEAKKLGIPENQMFMSLERRMRCGLGLCGHCQMNNVYVCRSGAVFRYSDIKGLSEALR